MTTSVDHSSPPPLSPPASMQPNIETSHYRGRSDHDVALDSELPGSRVNAAITRMLNGVRLSSSLWSNAGRQSSTGGAGGGPLHGGGVSHSNRLDLNMYGRSAYNYDSSSPRSRLLQRYSDRAYEGVYQPRKAVSLWQKSEQTNQRLKECLVDEVADNLRQQLGLLHLGVERGRSASGSLASFNRAIDEKEKNNQASLDSVEHNKTDYTHNKNTKSGLEGDCDHYKRKLDSCERVVGGRGESVQSNHSTPYGDNVYTGEEGRRRRRAHPQEQPRQAVVSSTTGSVTSPEHTPQSMATLQDTEHQQTTRQHHSPLYILQDGVNQTGGTNSINNNTSKQRRYRPKSMPPMDSAVVLDREGLSGHTPFTQLGTAARTPGHIMEYNSGSTGDPSTQFLPGSATRDNCQYTSSSGHPSPFNRPASRSPTTADYSTSPVIRGLPQPPSQTTMMIRDKRIPPMPSGRPPPLPKHLQDDLNTETTPEEDEIPLDPQAQEDKAVEELGVVPDGVNKNHLPLLRAKKVFEKELALRLEKKMEEEDQLLGDLRLCMEQPTMREKVESTMRVVQDVVKTKVTKDKNGNRMYSVVLELGKFHRKVKHQIKDFVVEIEGSTFGPPETSLSKVINIEFPESVVMEQLVLRQIGPSIEMEVPFKPNQLMNDLIDLVSKIDEDKEKQLRRNGITSGGSLSSDQTSMSSGEPEEEEQPPELPLSPPPPVVIKKPRPMRRRRRSTLGSTSSDSISSVVGKTEASKGTHNTRALNVDSEKINSAIIQGDRDQNEDKKMTDHLEPEGKVRGESVNIYENGTQQTKYVNRLSTDGKTRKTIEVNQTSSVFAPDECTQTKLEFDDNDFLTIRHIPVQDDKSETDSGIAMDKKPKESMSLLSEDYTSSLTKHENESNVSYQSNDEETELANSEEILCFTPELQDMEVLKSESLSCGEVKHDVDSDLTLGSQQESSNRDIKHENQSPQYETNVEKCSDVGGATTEVPTSISKMELNLSMNASESIESVGDTKLKVSVSEEKTDSSKGRGIHVISKSEPRLKKYQECHSVDLEPNEDATVQSMAIESSESLQHMVIESSECNNNIKLSEDELNEKSSGFLGLDGMTSDTKLDLSEVARHRDAEKRRPRNEDEMEMTQNESGVTTLAVTPLRNSVDLGKKPRKLYTTVPASQSSGDHEDDEKVLPTDTLQNRIEKPSESLEYYVRPRRRANKNENEVSHMGGTDRKEGTSEEHPYTKAEEYVRPKRRVREKNDEAKIHRTSEQESLSPVLRRRERKEIVIKKAQSLSEKVPSLSDKSNTSIQYKFSSLRSDKFRKDPSENIEASKQLGASETKRQSEKNQEKPKLTTSEDAKVPESRQHKSEVVMRKKQEQTSDSKTRFLRSKPDNVDLIEMRRKRYSLDPGKLQRTSDFNFEVSERRRQSGPRQRSAEDNLMKYGSDEQKKKSTEMKTDSLGLRKTNRYSLDDSQTSHGGFSKDNRWMKETKSVPRSRLDVSVPDNERVNKLKQMFENIGNEEQCQTNVARRKSLDRPGSTPPQRGLHKKFKSEFTLNL